MQEAQVLKEDSQIVIVIVSCSILSSQWHALNELQWDQYMSQQPGNCHPCCECMDITPGEVFHSPIQYLAQPIYIYRCTVPLKSETSSGLKQPLNIMIRNWLDFTVVVFSFIELLAASIPGSSTAAWWCSHQRRCGVCLLGGFVLLICLEESLKWLLGYRISWEMMLEVGWLCCLPYAALGAAQERSESGGAFAHGPRSCAWCAWPSWRGAYGWCAWHGSWIRWISCHPAAGIASLLQWTRLRGLVMYGNVLSLRLRTKSPYGLSIRKRKETDICIGWRKESRQVLGAMDEDGKLQIVFHNLGLLDQKWIESLSESNQILWPFEE